MKKIVSYLQLDLLSYSIFAGAAALVLVWKG